MAYKLVKTILGKILNTLITKINNVNLLILAHEYEKMAYTLVKAILNKLTM